MSEKKKAQEEEGGGESAPLWIISFADMISLLMAFFVMLSSFNEFDKKEKKKLDAVVSATLMQCGGWLLEKPKSTLSPGIAGEGDDVSDGPEKPSQEVTRKTGQIDQTHSRKFFTDKVFLIPMDFMFYSTGVALTTEGRQWLDDLSVYLTKMPGRILIAERRTESMAAAGPQRAIVAAEYLVQKNIDPERISISTRITTSNTQNQVVEISLLEKEIYP
jgi:chemotaxis protein MotB